MTLLLKVLDSNGIPVKISKAIFAIKKKNYNSKGTSRDPQTAKIFLKQKMEAVIFKI